MPEMGPKITEISFSFRAVVHFALMHAKILEFLIHFITQSLHPVIILSYF